MNRTPQQGGASVRMQGRIPSIDLASLVSLLLQALPAQERTGHALSWPALRYDPQRKRLVLNTYGVLRRLLASKDFRERFRHAEESGFLRDVMLPPKGFSARTGGRLFNNQLRSVSDSVIKLRRRLAEEMDAMGNTAAEVLVGQAGEAIARLAREMGARDPAEELTAHLVPIEFAKPDRPASARERDVARVISVEEDVQAEDWLERMTAAIVSAQQCRDDEFDDVQRDKLVETLKQDARKNDSQVTRFLNFLEDSALARVRLQVGFAIMEALAAQVTDGNSDQCAFADFVQRVLVLYNLYGAPEATEILELDLSRDYGLNAQFVVSDEFQKAMFYNCLPLWAEWNAQLFESRRVDPDKGGTTVAREVSYRFRVNGEDPRNERLHAFDSRLVRQRQALLGEEDPVVLGRFRLQRKLAEVVFLGLALNPQVSSRTVRAEAQQLVQRLHTEGKEGVASVLKEMEGWSRHVIGLSRVLVGLLQSKTRNVVAHAQRAVSDLYVVVQQDIVDWAAIERGRGRVSDPLVRPGTGSSEDVEWFKHIKIARKPEDVPANLFSLRVRTSLKERTLAMCDGAPTSVKAVRKLPDSLLNVCWVPVCVDDQISPHEAKPRYDVQEHWRMGVGIDVWYEPALLRLRGRRNIPEEDQRQYRAAAVTALTLLVYTFLQLVAERCTKERGERPATLMLRFQTQGREAARTEGEPLVYAAAQAVESALMRDVPVRMQGLVVQGNQLHWKKRGAVVALTSAFPLVMGATTTGAAKVALIVYSTRPCDDHPDIPDADGFMFRAKTYLAEAVTHPISGYRLRFDRMQAHVVSSQGDFRSPKLIVEEVSRLHEQGCDHVMLLSDHFGNRRLNRSAQRHSPHTQTKFLAEVATKFADVSVYMLRRDVFPATRLHKRDRQESAFEVLRLSEHEELTTPLGDELLKQLVPAYTFATLSIVGNDDVARPQSGFCTYFLDTDYQVQNLEGRERVRSNLIGANTAVRESLLAVLRGIHFLEAEKAPMSSPSQFIFQPVLDPFTWLSPASHGAAGEIEVFPASRRKGAVLLSLPALLSQVTDSLHRGTG